MQNFNNTKKDNQNILKKKIDNFLTQEKARKLFVYLQLISLCVYSKKQRGKSWYLFTNNQNFHINKFFNSFAIKMSKAFLEDNKEILYKDKGTSIKNIFYHIISNNFDAFLKKNNDFQSNLAKYLDNYEVNQVIKNNNDSKTDTYKMFDRYFLSEANNIFAFPKENVLKKIRTTLESSKPSKAKISKKETQMFLLLCMLGSFLSTLMFMFKFIPHAESENGKKTQLLLYLIIIPIILALFFFQYTF